ncbi:MAG: YdbH domain-containing protein, partial [Victivallaceae bacterium]|nr:YdbH domain-containing protein [Victivallaceae bacterium]
ILGGVYYYLFKIYLPNRFQKEILPNLMRDAGISGFSGKVRSAGPYGANLGELCVGDPANPTLKVRSVIIKYRFQNILMPRKPDITSLELNGLELICRIRDRKLEINNIDVQRFIEQLRKHFSGEHKKAIGSWESTRFRVTGGLLHLDWNDNRLLLPFELSFYPGQQNWKTFNADLQFVWREHPVKAELKTDLENKTAAIKFNAGIDMKKALNLIEKSQHLPGLSELDISGEFDVDGNISFGFSPWQIRKMAISGTFKNSEIHYGVLSLYNKQRPSGLKIPLTISLNSSGDAYVWKLENGLMKKPVALFVKNLSCRIPGNKKDSLDFGGEMELDLSRTKLGEYYDIEKISEIHLARKITGRFNRVTGNWQLQTADDGDKAAKSSIKSLVTCNDVKIFTDIGELEFSGRGCRRNGSLAVKMLIRELSGTGNKNAFFCNNVELRSDFSLIPASDSKVRIKNNHFKFSVPEFLSSSADKQIEVKNLTISGTNSFDDFAVNGFKLLAESESIKIKQNSSILESEKNKFVFDGIFQKGRKTWEMAVATDSGCLKGTCCGRDFEFAKVETKNFLSIYPPLLKSSGLGSCNFRLKCESGKYGDKDEFLQFTGFNIAAALGFEGQFRLREHSFTGDISRIEAKYPHCGIAAAGVEITGKFKHDGGVDNDEPDMNFLSSVDSGTISVAQNGTEYSGRSAHFKLTGKIFEGMFEPKFMKAGLTLPSVSVSCGKEQIKIADIALKAEGSFMNRYDIARWRSLHNLELELISDKISGIWKEINISSGKNRVSVKSEIDLTGSGCRLKNLFAGISVETAVAYSKSWKLASRKINANAKGDGQAGSQMNLASDIRLDGFYASSGTTSLNVPDLMVGASLKEGNFSGNAACDKAAFYKNDIKLACKDISLRLPFGADARDGKLTVNKVELRKRRLGKVNAKLKFEDENLLLQANHFSEIFSDASMFFSGRMKLPDFPEWEGDFSIPEFQVKNIRNIQFMFPGLEASFIGKVALEGHLRGNLDKCGGSGSISINKGILNFGGWELSGVNADCQFSDLFSLETMPGQKLYCRQINNGSTEFSNARLEFRMRGKRELLVDRFAAEWFGGRLTDLGPFVIKNNNSEPEKVNFLASEIVLSPLLEYLGIKGFVSDALVEGIVPLKLQDGKLSIAGASLATKAGRMGILRLDDDWNQYIEAGAEPAQMNRKKFAAAALERFNYNWIRLNVTATPKTSRVELAIDGYPLKTVPFKYNTEKSLFEPVSPGEPGLNRDMTIETEFVIPR